MSDAYRIDLHRPRSIREILLATLALYRRYPLLFVVLALAVIGPYDLAFLGITGYGPLVALAHKARALGWLNVLLRALLVGALVSALHIHAVIAVGDGRKQRLRTVALVACGYCWSWVSLRHSPSRSSTSTCRRDSPDDIRCRSAR